MSEAKPGSVPPPPSADLPVDEQVLVLRARVAALEAQLAEHARATNEIVRRSQEKLYWLERWHVDLDSVMQKPGAEATLEGLKRVRGIARRAKRAKRKYLGG